MKIDAFIHRYSRTQERGHTSAVAPNSSLVYPARVKSNFQVWNDQILNILLHINNL